MTLQPAADLIEKIVPFLGNALVTTEVVYGEGIITVAADKIVKVLTVLRDEHDLAFKQLMDICAVDHPQRPQRFEVVYHVLSLRYNQRMRIKLHTNAATAVPTVAHVFNAANWYEREAFDLFGILFDGHPDLRRILTDYGFQGYPMRKDFPLTGYVEPHYDDQQKKVVYAPVHLPQEFRQFDFLSPWQGMVSSAPVLPGDEKAEGTSHA